MIWSSDRSREALSQDVFDRLLGLLDADRDRAGQLYERLRAKLVRYFEWNGSSVPEDLADRTIDRVGRKIGQGEKIQAEDPSAYFYGVARNILRESWDDLKRSRDAVREGAVGAEPLSDRPAWEKDADAERRQACLDRCLQRLPPESRDLLLRYYEGEKGARISNREMLADRLGISVATLRIRICRLKAQVQDCVGSCLEARLETKSRFGQERVKTYDR